MERVMNHIMLIAAIGFSLILLWTAAAPRKPITVQPEVSIDYQLSTRDLTVYGK